MANGNVAVGGGAPLDATKLNIKWRQVFTPSTYMKRIRLKTLSGSEGDYTNSLLLLVKNMLRSKLHCQKGFNFDPLLI